MTRWPRRQATAFVWLVVALVAGLIWVSAEATIRHQEDQARANALEGAMLRARAAAADLESTLEATAGLHILAQARATLLERGDLTGALAIQFQLQALALRPVFGISGMAVTDRQGVVTWTINGQKGNGQKGNNQGGGSGHAPVSLADLPYFGLLRDTPATLAVGQPRSTLRFADRPGLPVARELYDRQGQFAGISVVGLDTQALARQIARPDLRQQGLAVLVRPADGQVLVRSPATDSAGAAEPAAVAAVLALARTEPEGRAPVRNPGTGRWLLTGWSGVEPAGLLVTIALDAGTALADTRREAAIIRAVATALSLLDIMGGGGLLLLRARRRTAEALAQARRAQQATEAARAELERLVASLPAMVYHGDLAADGTLTSRYITANAAQVIGWPHDRLPPRDTFLAHVDPGLGQEVAAFFAGLLKGGPDTLEYRMARPDGSWVWLRHHARVVARHGEAGGEVIGSLADITEERALRAQAAISSQLASLGEMAGGIAHELNRPLAVMVMAAHNALAALEDPEPDLGTVRGRLERIGEQGVRANRIIHHLQALSRPTNEPQEQVCLRSAVEGAMTLAGGALRQAHVAVENLLPPDLPPVLGQVVAIEQVLVNLFTNARDAMASRPPDARRLRLIAHAEGGQVVMEVADSGPGVPEAILSRIFEPFFTTKAAGQGTGLGLSICHAAMREMGGGITARNTPEGTVFRLTFQRVPAA